MKRTFTVLALFVAAIALLSTNCGTSDYIKSLTLTSNSTSAGSSSGGPIGGSYNLVGVDGTLQLKVYANYNSGKNIDVTNASVFTMVPTGTVYSSADPVNYPPGGPLPAPAPNTVTIDGTGFMTGIAPVCTWVDATTVVSGVVTPVTPPAWEYTGFYQVTATYRSFTSQPVGVGMGIAVSNDPGQGCGPS
ncbi:MAG: hypothetical protein ACLPHP_22130 [Candidatus Sulfotelmatobacter sp.]